MCQEECGASYISGTRLRSRTRGGIGNVYRFRTTTLGEVRSRLDPARAIPMPVSGDLSSDKLDICNKKSTRQWKAASKPIRSDRDRQRLFPFSRHFASTDDRYGRHPAHSHQDCEGSAHFDDNLEHPMHAGSQVPRAGMGTLGGVVWKYPAKGAGTGAEPGMLLQTPARSRPRASIKVLHTGLVLPLVERAYHVVFEPKPAGDQALRQDVG